MDKYNPLTVMGGNSFIRVIEHNGRFIQTMDECADVMNELQQRLSEAESQLPKWHSASTPPSHSDWVYMVYVFDGCVRKGVGRYVNGAEPYWISASRDQIKVLQWMDHPLEVTGDIYG